MESAYTWTGDIALITKSEFIRTYSNNNCLNAKALRNSACINYLSDVGYIISPLMNETGIVLIAVTNRIGGVEINNNPSTVRPSLYLKTNITLTGNGTNDENIYKIIA